MSLVEGEKQPDVIYLYTRLGTEKHVVINTIKCQSSFSPDSDHRRYFSIEDDGVSTTLERYILF